MPRLTENERERIVRKRERPLTSPSDLHGAASRDNAAAMNAILADVFALYLKTQNFHWHVSGPHFRDYHLMLDEHADQLLGMTDAVAERVRKLGRAPSPRSAMSPACSACATTTRRTSSPRTCWPSCPRTIACW